MQCPLTQRDGLTLTDQAPWLDCARLDHVRPDHVRPGTLEEQNGNEKRFKLTYPYRYISGAAFERLRLPPDVLLQTCCLSMIFNKSVSTFSGSKAEPSCRKGRRPSCDPSRPRTIRLHRSHRSCRCPHRSSSRSDA